MAGLEIGGRAMLKRLKLSNFKVWNELSLPLGRVTGLFGGNSSGKSSILQFLLMLKQTKNASDRSVVLHFGNRGSGDFVELGGFRDIVHRNDTSRTIEWALEWGHDRVTIGDPQGSRRETLYDFDSLLTECAVHMYGGDIRPYMLKYVFESGSFSVMADQDSPKYALSGGDYSFLRNPGRPWGLPGPVKTHLFPDQAKTYYQNTGFLSVFETEYERLMDRIHYLGPLREVPRREYFWSGTSPHDTGVRGERTIEAILSATKKGETRNLARYKRHKGFQEMIGYWLDQLGLATEFGVAEIASESNLYRAAVRKDEASAEAVLPDVGFGVSQVLPALVLLYYVPRGSIVLMEQPEIHLHPSAQGGLADAILSAARARDLQVIVESHSEHLLRRLQLRVAKEEASSDEVKLYATNVVDGVGSVSDLDLTPLGEIRNWPKHFFGDEMGEITAIRQATLVRRLRLA